MTPSLPQNAKFGSANIGNAVLASASRERRNSLVPEPLITPTQSNAGPFQSELLDQDLHVRHQSLQLALPRLQNHDAQDACLLLP